MSKDKIENHARTIDVNNVSRHQVYKLSIYLKNDCDIEKLETSGLFFANDDTHAEIIARGIAKNIGFTNNPRLEIERVSEGWLWG